MKRARLWLIVAGLSLSAAAASGADRQNANKAGDKGAVDTAAAESSGRPVRLTKPWSQIASLKEDQKQKIYAIHRKALDEINAIEAKEKQDIMAVLTTEQKAELKAAQQKESADRKAARASASKNNDDDEKDAKEPRSSKR